MYALILVVILLILFYIQQKKTYSYWAKKGVKYVTPVPIFGNMFSDIFNISSSALVMNNLYKSFPHERYMGMFQMGQPVLILRDLDLVKQITTKDFINFVDHIEIIDPMLDPLWGTNLFASTGARWRELRQTLSPIFTSSKMKLMFNFMNECAQEFVDHFKKQKGDVVELNMKDVFSRYTNDVIASTAFGIKCQSLTIENNEFYVMGKELAKSTENFAKFFLYSAAPFLARMLNLKIFTDKLANFFRKVIAETLKARRQQNIQRPDLINLLLQAQKGTLSYDEDSNNTDMGFATVTESEVGRHRTSFPKLTDEDITAQALIFFFGGYDTSSHFMSLLSYELAANPEIQNKVRMEIRETLAKCDNKITYQELLGMKYYDMVISETLRKWPLAFRLDRKCTKTFTIEPVNAGETRLIVNEGDIVFIPVFGIQRDPKNYPNPDVFDPERFSEKNRKNFVMDAYMPFGAGPRSCIGNRFALLETKALFFHILREFEIVPTEKSRIPMMLDPAKTLLSPIGGFYYGFKKLRE